MINDFLILKNNTKTNSMGLQEILKFGHEIIPMRAGTRH